MSARKLIEPGTLYGRLTVLGLARSTAGILFYDCVCICGHVRHYRAGHLRSGLARSCGCSRKGNRGSSHGNFRHGKNDSDPTYVSWSSMRERCLNVKHKSWERYGGKGISVCERWNAFTAFLQDMGERPHGTTLDRKDPCGNYEPSNCQWADVSTQQNSKAVCRRLTFSGKTQASAQWAAELGISDTLMRWRLSNGWSVEEAVTLPARFAKRTSRTR